MKRRKQRLEEDPEAIELIEEEQKDQQILGQVDLPKPEQPSKFNEKEVKAQIEEKFKQIKRRPGEPILEPELSFTSNVTSSNQCPPYVRLSVPFI